jgi:hypothetical protein
MSPAVAVLGIGATGAALYWWWNQRVELPAGLEKPPIRRALTRGGNTYNVDSYRTGVAGRQFHFARHTEQPSMWLGYYSQQGQPNKLWKVAEPDDVPERVLATQIRKDFGV